MDAAERLFTTRGYRAATMEVIAREAGYSRTAAYRQFATRRDLLAAMVQRITQRHMAAMLERMPPGVTPLELMAESLIIVATELVRDPLLHNIAEQMPDGTIASFIARDPALTTLVETGIESALAEDAGQFRAGLHPHDLAQFIIGTAMSLLLEVVPGADDPEVARGYVQTFILPAIAAHPPEPRRVFPQLGDVTPE